MVWTKAAYSERLDENITSLIVRIRRGTYHPQAARITEIPKEDGSKRPLALSCIEDKLVQLAVSDILSSVYEPLFLPCSYGFPTGIKLSCCFEGFATANVPQLEWRGGGNRHPKVFQHNSTY